MTWLDNDPIKPEPEARERLNALLAEHPTGIPLYDAARALIHQDKAKALRDDVFTDPESDFLSVIQIEARRTLLGALQTTDAFCELRFLPPELNADYCAVRQTQIGRMNLYAFDLAKSEIKTKTTRCHALIFLKITGLQGVRHKVETSTKRAGIEEWIVERFGERVPPGTTAKELARKYKEATGITVDARTVRRALGKR